MAKRKTPKSEKIVDLKPKAEKITEQELEQLRNLVNASNIAHRDVGMIESRKHTLLHEIVSINEAIKKHQDTLEEVYGTCSVDISTGEIKREKDEQANS